MGVTTITYLTDEGKTLVAVAYCQGGKWTIAQSDAYNLMPTAKENADDVMYLHRVKLTPKLDVEPTERAGTAQQSSANIEAESPTERKAKLKTIMDQSDEEMREAFRRAKAVSDDALRNIGIEPRQPLADPKPTEEQGPRHN